MKFFDYFSCYFLSCCSCRWFRVSRFEAGLLLTRCHTASVVRGSRLWNFFSFKFHDFYFYISFNSILEVFWRQFTVRKKREKFNFRHSKSDFFWNFESEKFVSWKWVSMERTLTFCRWWHWPLSLGKLHIFCLVRFASFYNFFFNVGPP